MTKEMIHKPPVFTDISTIATKILALPQTKNRLKLAIAGPPGSGKSTLAETLVARIGPKCGLIPMDGFHLDNNTLDALGLLSVKGAPETFDRQGFSVLVDALSERKADQFPIFNRKEDRVIAAGGSVFEDTSILLFEGNYLLFDEPGWRDLAKKWDASIWLDVPEAVLEARLIQRWRDHGLSDKDAKMRARSNDLANARRIAQNALPATWIVRL